MYCPFLGFICIVGGWSLGHDFCFAAPLVGALAGVAGAVVSVWPRECRAGMACGVRAGGTAGFLAGLSLFPFILFVATMSADPQFHGYVTNQHGVVVMEPSLTSGAKCAAAVGPALRVWVAVAVGTALVGGGIGVLIPFTCRQLKTTSPSTAGTRSVEPGDAADQRGM